MIDLESGWVSHILVSLSTGIFSSTYCCREIASFLMTREGAEVFLVWMQEHVNVLFEHTRMCFSKLKHQASLCQLSFHDGVFLKLAFLDCGSLLSGITLAIVQFLLTPRKRANLCAGCFSHCCDEIPERSKAGRIYCGPRFRSWQERWVRAHGCGSWR